MAVRCIARREEDEIRDSNQGKLARQSSCARGNGRRAVKARNGQVYDWCTVVKLRCDTTVVAPASRRMQASGARRAVRGAGWACGCAGSRGVWAGLRRALWEGSTGWSCARTRACADIRRQTWADIFAHSFEKAGRGTYGGSRFKTLRGLAYSHSRRTSFVCLSDQVLAGGHTPSPRGRGPSPWQLPPD